MKYTLLMIAWFSLPNALLGEETISRDGKAVIGEWRKYADGWEGRLGNRADRFVGFIEGRMKVTAPDWWLSYLRTAHISEVGSPPYFKAKKIGLRWSRLSEDVHFTGFDNANMSPHLLTLWKGRNVCKLDAKTVFREWPGNERDWLSRSAVAGTVTSKYCFLTKLHSIHSCYGPRHLSCFDTKSGMEVWQVRLIDGVLGNSHSGAVPPQFIEIREDGDLVSVWSCNLFAACLQVFDVHDGRVRLRFTTNQFVSTDPIEPQP